MRFQGAGLRIPLPCRVTSLADGVRPLARDPRCVLGATLPALCNRTPVALRANPRPLPLGSARRGD